MIHSEHGEMKFNAKQIAILLISAIGIAGVTFAIGYLSKGKPAAEKPAIAAKPSADTPAAPGAITKKLDTDAILKEREIEKSAAPGSKFTFQKTLVKDAPPAKDVPASPKPAPAAPAKTDNKEPQATASTVKQPAEPKAVEKKPDSATPKEKPKHDAKPAATKPAPATGKVFTIQIGSFSSKADAEKLVAKMESKRFLTSVTEFKDKTGLWYRVRVGMYKTEQAAARELAKVKAESSQNAFVTGY